MINISKTIKRFSIYWFFPVIATSILTLMTFFIDFDIVLKNYLTSFFNISSYILFVFVFLLFMYNALFSKKFDKILNDPKEIHSFFLFPISLLFLSLQALEVSNSLLFSLVLWSIGSIFCFYLSIFISYLIYIKEKIKLEDINGSWFFPQIAYLLVSFSGFLLFLFTKTSLFYYISVLSLGIAVVLYLGMFSISLYRFIFAKPLKSNFAPFLWMDVSVVSLLIISIHLSGIPYVSVISFALWGFSIWWFILSLFITLHYIKYLNFVKESWWAMIIPIGLIYLSTYYINPSLPCNLFAILSIPLYILSFSIWLSDILRVIIWSE